MMTSLLIALSAFVGGAMAALAAVRRAAGGADAGPLVPAPPPAPVTAQQPLPANAMSDGAGAADEERFGHLVRDTLDDLLRQHGAVAGLLWRAERGVLIRERVAGDATLAQSLEASLAPLVQWALREGLAMLGPDGDAPRAVVAPLVVPGEEPSGAFALLFAEPYTGDRAALKRWMGRHGGHLHLLRELLTVRHELALTNRRIRHILREVAQWDAAAMDASLGAHYCALVQSLLSADGTALVRWDEATQRGLVVAAGGQCAPALDHAVDADSLVADACRENVPGLWHDVAGHNGVGLVVVARNPAPLRGSILVHPLRRRTEVIGAMVVANATPGALRPSDLRTLSLVDVAATSRLVGSWQIAEVSQRALVDGLTGLTNRRGFEAAMTVAREEANRFGWETSLLVVDVDHFKAVNDTVGHEAGDAVLRAVTRALDDGVREIDVCARVGGEEIAILLKNTGAAGAEELAQRLRSAIEQLRVETSGGTIRVTASFGVATHPSVVEDWEALFRCADQALYAAKHGGRNQVRHAGRSTGAGPDAPQRP